jgi:F-type H+-transporting ATPase subunit b
MIIPTVRILPVCVILIAVYLLLPIAALAAEEGGGEGGALLMIGKIFNVALVIGVLVWIGRKPLAEFFKNRTQSIREQLEEAQQARRDAEARLAEMQHRMRNLDEELKEIRSASEREARAEYERLVAEAERDAEKIVARARQEIDGMTRAGHLELKAHAAELSVRLAEEKIREVITDEDRARLFGQFVRQLGGKG